MASWTSPKTWNVGDVLTAADMNTYVRDNTTFLSSPTGATVATSQTTASASYVDLATAGPAVTVTTGLNAIVAVGAQMANAGAGDGAGMSYAVSGATTTAANNAWAAEYSSGVAGGYPQASLVSLASGLNAGSNTFTAKYIAFVGGTAVFADRWIIVWPLP